MRPQVVWVGPVVCCRPLRALDEEPLEPRRSQEVAWMIAGMVTLTMVISCCKMIFISKCQSILQICDDHWGLIKKLGLMKTCSCSLKCEWQTCFAGFETLNRTPSGERCCELCKHRWCSHEIIYLSEAEAASFFTRKRFKDETLGW